MIHHTTAHNHLFLSARREQIDPIHSPCTLLTASECNTVLSSREQVQRSSIGAAKCICSPRASASFPVQGATTYRRSLVHTRAAKRHTACSTCLYRYCSDKQVHLSKRWQIPDSNAETERATIGRLAQFAPRTEQTQHRRSLLD